MTSSSVTLSNDAREEAIEVALRLVLSAACASFAPPSSVKVISTLVSLVIGTAIAKSSILILRTEASEDLSTCVSSVVFVPSARVAFPVGEKVMTKVTR